MSESSVSNLAIPARGVKNREKTVFAKQNLLTIIGSAILRVLILFLSLISRTYIPFVILRLLNIRGSFLKSVFLCYSGNSRYAKHYCFRITQSWLKWFPTPIGIYKQGRFWGLVFASPMTEKDFTDSKNKEKIELIINRLKLIGKLVGAENVQLAGILPSFLEKRLPQLKLTSNSLTVKAITAAIAQIQINCFAGQIKPIILLGGNGKVGRALQDEILMRSKSIFIVDPNNGLNEMPSELFGKECLLVDVSRANCLEKYSNQLWPELVILNETFPEPKGQIINSIRNRGLKMFHLSGVAGQVFPSLPMGYAGSVPCCAMHDFENDLKPVLAEL